MRPAETALRSDRQPDFGIGVNVTPGNVHDSIAWDKLYEDVAGRFDVQFVAMDAAYKTPWIAKKR